MIGKLNSGQNLCRNYTAFSVKKAGYWQMILQLRSRYSYSIFNSLLNEKPNLGDNMTGENNLIYSLTLLIYIQVNEYLILFQ